MALAISISRCVRLLFDARGCRVSDEKDVAYGANGFCKACRVKLQHRLRQCLKRRADATTPDRYGSKFLEDAKEARRLLRGFPASVYIKAQSHPVTKCNFRNPARDAFVVMNNYVSSGDIDKSV